MITVLPGRADTSDGKVDSTLACAHARAGHIDRRFGRMRQRSTPVGGGRGFNSSRRGRPATAPGLMRRFFLLPKLLISFPEIKHSNVDPGDFSKEFKGSQPGHLPIPRFIFRA